MSKMGQSMSAPRTSNYDEQLPKSGKADGDADSSGPRAGLRRIATTHVDCPREFSDSATPLQAHVQTLVRDACLNTMTCYYVVSVGENSYFRSIWSDEDWCVWFCTMFNRPRTKLFWITLSVVSMIGAVFEQPSNDRIFGRHKGEIALIGHVLFFVTHFLFLSVFLVVMRCFWPQRKHWWHSSERHSFVSNHSHCETRPTEHLWTLMFGFGVITSLLVRVGWMVHTFIHEGELESGWSSTSIFMYKVHTIYGTIHSGIDTGVRVFRCFYLIYFSHTMRYAFISAMQLTKKLGSILGLIVVFFLFFYFSFLVRWLLTQCSAARYAAAS